MADAGFAVEGVDDGVDHRRRRADGARFARAFDAERVGRAGHVVRSKGEERQIVGGVAQGVGQALMEDIHFDPASGQLVSGSFMDYAMPRASDLSNVAMKSNPAPTPTNPLGVKGCGEAGCAGGLASVMNAVVDALSPLGIRHIDMPATPSRGWAAIQAANGKQA